jgi:uncharacterized protein
MSALHSLEEVIRAYPSVLVALSGGIDSTLLALVAHRTLEERALAVTVASEFYIGREGESVERFVREFHINHRFVKEEILPDPAVRRNPEDRCFHCKRRVFQRLLEIAGREGIEAVADGTNGDDLMEDRPGIRALRELGIVSPYLDAQMSKSDILQLASDLGLRSYIHPSNTCLATRIPHGTLIGKDVLRMIDEGENAIVGKGFRVVRVRYHEPATARIEVGADELERLLKPETYAPLLRELRSLGFAHVSVDLEGYGR